MTDRRRQSAARIALAMAAVALPALLAAPVAAQTEARLDPAVAAATFDSAWTRIHRTHFDSTFNGVDWPAVRDELRPKAVAAASTAELRGVLDDMIGRLRQSHFYLIPAEADRTLSGDPAASTGGDPGLDVRLVDGRVLVTKVVPGSAAEAAGVRTGWAVEAAGTLEARALMEALDRLPAGTDPRAREFQAAGAVRGRLLGPAGSRVPVRFADGGGKTVRLELERRPARGTTTKYGNLPEVNAVLDSRRVAAPGGASAGVIAFNIWLPALSPAFDRAVDEHRDADGIVIDLRGNPGGLGAMAMGFAGHFTARRDTLGTMKLRGSQLYFVANPRRVDTQARPVEPYRGPVAILTDALSVSTSEIFAGGMQKLGLARVFGETTQGAALPAMAARLPSGDVLMHAFADFLGPDGRSWEGAGVVPDVAAPPSREALLAGRDPALEAALRWIAEEKQARAAAR